MPIDFRKSLIPNGLLLVLIGASVWIALELDGSEFSFGASTGPLLKMFEIGVLGLIGVLALSIFRSRFSPIAFFASWPLTIPVFVYLTYPFVLQRYFMPGPWSITYENRLYWNPEAFLGLSLLTVLAIFYLRKLAALVSKSSA